MNLEKCYQCSATLKFLWTSGISLVIEIFAPWWLSYKLEYLDFKAEGFVGNTKMWIFLEQKISISNTFFSKKVEAALRRKFSVCKKGFYWVYSLNLQVFRFCKDIGRSKLFTYVMICHIFGKIFGATIRIQLRSYIFDTTLISFIQHGLQDFHYYLHVGPAF